MYALPAVKQGHELVITFQLPSLFEQYRTKAEDYLSHFLGHEGPGSLLALLKSRGWATALCAGCGDTGYERNSLTFMFEVSITLTEAGIAAGAHPVRMPQHVQDIDSGLLAGGG